MNIYNKSKENSILNKFLSEIRDISIQKDAMRFRRNIERIGEILGYELSKSLEYTKITTTTPLGEKETYIPDNDVVLCSILRAGLPLHQGVLNYFDNAENAFISAYRMHQSNDEEFDIVVEYFASPSIEGKTLILIDPMLATGKSLVAVLKGILKYGIPKKIHILSVIGSSEGVAYVEKNFPESTDLWIATIDQKLNNKGYIIPGLGDAGDLAYGKKK